MVVISHYKSRRILLLQGGCSLRHVAAIVDLVNAESNAVLADPAIKRHFTE
jgi:hypothetical protein